MTTRKQKEKIGKVMHEFAHGKLYSGSGHKVTDRSQAIAIALSEAGVPKKMMGGAAIVTVVPVMEKGGMIQNFINWLNQEF